jgi:uncharacterized metal-binding protein YceD (DUF177 family)
MRREDLLDLNDVLQHPGRKVAVDISTELPDEADIDLVAPLEGYLEAISTGNILLITGQFKTRVVVECARCVSPLEMDLEFEVDEQFPVEGVPSSFSQQDFAKVTASDEPHPLFEENNLIVEALLRQALLLAIPLQPLCEYGWDGSCPIAAQLASANKAASQGRSELQQLSRFLHPGDNQT